MRIAKLIADRQLVTIRRRKIDNLQIQGYLLAASKRLLLLHYVYDFRLDGLMVLARSAISQVVRTATDSFQHQLLDTNGVYKEVDFSDEYPLESWSDFLEAAKERYKFVILEEECLREPTFAIGEIVKVGNRRVSVRHFTGVGRWEPQPVKLRLSELTSCQIRNNYLNTYETYFAREPNKLLETDV